MDIATVTSYTSQAKANQNNGGSGQAEWIIHLSKWFSSLAFQAEFCVFVQN
jgi:hypothetical protein